MIEKKNIVQRPLNKMDINKNKISKHQKISKEMICKDRNQENEASILLLKYFSYDKV